MIHVSQDDHLKLRESISEMLVLLRNCCRFAVLHDYFAHFTSTTQIHWQQTGQIVATSAEVTPIVV